MVHRLHKEPVAKSRCPHAGSNYGPPVYKTGALPLSYKGAVEGLLKSFAHGGSTPVSMDETPQNALFSLLVYDRVHRIDTDLSTSTFLIINKSLSPCFDHRVCSSAFNYLFWFAWCFNSRARPSFQPRWIVNSKFVWFDLFFHRNDVSVFSTMLFFLNHWWVTFRPRRVTIRMIKSIWPNPTTRTMTTIWLNGRRSTINIAWSELVMLEQTQQRIVSGPFRIDSANDRRCPIDLANVQQQCTFVWEKRVFHFNVSLILRQREKKES